MLAATPLLSLVSPPWFGHLADRTGRADRVLRLVSFGALAGFAPMALVSSFPPLLAAILCYALFASSIVPLVDSLTLARVLSRGESYARIRLFGSIGFVVSSIAFGFWVDRIDRRTVIVPVVLIALYALWSLRVRARAEPAPIGHPLQGLGLLRDRPLALWLAACALHWIASAPFHGTFSIHVAALGLPPWVVGLSSGLGVLAEVGVMAIYPRFASRVHPRTLLGVALLVSAVRWVGMALVSSAGAIVALSLLHGFTFGAFYVAAVAFVAERVPALRRASGQGLFVAVTFGVGGLVGYLTAGAGYDLLGGHRLFAFGAVVELLAFAVLLGVNPRQPGASEAP